MTGQNIIFKLNNLGLAYDRNQPTFLEALSGVDLTITAGERLAIIGPSGCGKSSLLYLLCGLLKPTQGDIHFDGLPLTGPKPNIALILQDYGLFPWKTVWQNVALGLKIQKISKAEQQTKVKDILNKLGILDQSQKYPAQLSGGQKQRVAIARALVLKPKVLLLDEPFAALDAITKENLEDLIVGISQQENLTLIFVTHNIEEAVSISNRIVVFGQEQGRISQIINNVQADMPSKKHSPAFYEKCEELRATLGVLDSSAEIGGGLDEA